MPIKELRDIKNQIDDMDKQLDNWVTFFTVTDDCTLESETAKKLTKCAAYNGKRNDVIEKTGDNKYKYRYGGTVEDIFDELKSMRFSGEFFIDQLRYIEHKIKESLKKTNNDIKVDKAVYELADDNYESNNNTNAATGILKIDSYDRNIEENFYIMYYLLSYGFLGFFIYKLLKL